MTWLYTLPEPSGSLPEYLWLWHEYTIASHHFWQDVITHQCNNFSNMVRWIIYKRSYATNSVAIDCKINRKIFVRYQLVLFHWEANIVMEFSSDKMMIVINPFFKLIKCTQVVKEVSPLDKWRHNYKSMSGWVKWNAFTGVFEWYKRANVETSEIIACLFTIWLRSQWHSTVYMTVQ